MTIPSRPAPPPPQQTSRENGGSLQILTKSPATLRSTQSRYGAISSNASETISSVTHSSKRYEYTTKTSAGGTCVLQGNSGTKNRYNKVPPPRPPPPKINRNKTLGDTVLKKPGPPQSVNVLSNIFGKKKSHVVKKQPSSKIVQQSLGAATVKSQMLNSQRIQNGGVQLISFDSPPSSPTLTQKSNSDCVSIDSFSSDSNISSPNNGNTSQTESGFEDDFASPPDPWEALANDPFRDNSKYIINDLRVTQPVRNLHAINKTQTDDVLCNGKSLLPPVAALTMPTIIKPRTLQQSQNTRNISPVGTAINSNGHIRNVFKDSEYFDDSLPSPPMPSCPPPPPPEVVSSNNVLEVITGKLDAIELIDDNKIEGPSYGIALYDFEGVEDNDLSFRESEKIYLLQRLDEEWYLGRNRKGCEGIFPANYIDVKVPIKGNEVSVTKQSTQNNAAPASNSYKSNRIRALYKFTPEVPEDLALDVNDMVTVFYRINNDWLYGEVGNKKGQFPANFIEFVPENLPQMESN